MLLLAGQTALAGSGIEISRDLSATSKANNLSLSYSLNAFENTETETVDLANRWSYDLTEALTTVNLNSLLADFAIKSVTHRLSYELVLVEDLTLAVKYGRTFFNSDEARQDVLAGGFYYQLGELQLGYAASNTDTYQVQKVELLGTDYTDTIRYNRKSGSYYLSFNWTKNLTTSVNFTQYNYDKNLDNSYAVLTTLPLLNRGSAAVANDVGSQLKSSLDLNLAFF